MYDAKDYKEKNTNLSVSKNSCVADRAYFTNVHRECLMSFKSSYISTDKIIKLE